MNGTNPVAEILFNYLRDVLYRPSQAKLRLEDLPEDFHELGKGLQYFVQCVTETRMLADALSRGNLNLQLPPSSNEMASPLKALHASLKHLTWQTRQVANGDYSQRIDFMGDFANAFNNMVAQLDRQRAALTEAKIVAEAASESKSAFLATVSHEIRTPLNAIIGLSEIQLQKPLPEDAHADLEKIWNSGSSLLGIINDILDISKIEAGKFEIVQADYDLATLVNDTVQLNIVRISSKDVSFELCVDETAPARLFGDEMRVRQILNNLLSNAFKYTEEGHVAFDVAWRRHEATAILTFTVSDSGIGIKEEDIGKLFKEYSQLDSRANRQIEGTGLGLSITKRLVELMGGTISAESEYGVGSVFKVELPQKISKNAPIGKDIAESLMQLRLMENRLARGKNMVRSHMPYGRVLVVDDVATNRDVAKGLMLPYGLSIDCVAGGREAIEKIRSIGDSAPAAGKYDVVFMDHMMPDMDGVEATRIIRGEIGTEYARTVPIIALTANAVSGVEEMFSANGFNGFIPKPIDIMKLDAVLNKWVRDRQSDETLISAEREHAANLPSRVEPKPGWTSVDGLNIAEGARRYEGEAAYLQILKSYAIHAPELLGRLGEFLESSMPDYAVAVHGLKGASYGICANEVGKIAETLEAAAKAGDFETVRANHERLANMVSAILSDINYLLQTTAGFSIKEAKRALRDAPNRELLQEMRLAAERSRTSEMNAIMSKLEQYEYESGGEIVAWVRERMDNLEYRAICNRLRELAS